MKPRKLRISMKPRKLRNKRKVDLSFARFFHPEKSPHAQFDISRTAYVYFPKHVKREGHLVWPVAKLGTYRRQKHGPLKYSRNEPQTT